MSGLGLLLSAPVAAVSSRPSPIFAEISVLGLLYFWVGSVFKVCGLW